VIAQYGDNAGRRRPQWLLTPQHNRAIGTAFDVDAEALHIHIPEFSHRRLPVSVLHTD
jgi:hypothetical protein